MKEDLFAGYSSEFRKELEYLKKYNGADDEELRRHIECALSFAREDGAEDTMGITYYYIANAFFFTENLKETKHYADLAGTCLMNTQNYVMLMYLYNLYGVIMIMEGNDNAAADYLMTVIDLAKEHQAYIMGGMACENIGGIYVSYGAYDEALPMYQKSRRMFAKDKNAAQLLYIMINLQAWSGICMLHTGRMQNIIEYENTLEQLVRRAEDAGRNYPKFAVFLFRAQELVLAGERDSEKAAEVIAELEKMADEAPYSEYYLEYRDYYELLMKYGDRQKTAHFAQRLKDIIADSGFTDYMKVAVCAMLIRCCRWLGEEEEAQKYCVIYFELSSIKLRQTCNNIHNTVETHERIYGMHKAQQKILLENQKLAMEARMDELTGIPNRAAFDDLMEKMFAEPQLSENSFAIEILDIDQFKSINDTYGHLAGDDCLRVLGKCLQKAALDEHFFAARYGGDEFVVIIKDKTREEIGEFASALLEAVKKENIPNINSGVESYVTISQGICCHESCHERVSVLECLAQADRALYLAKQKGGNRFEILMNTDVSPEDKTWIGKRRD